MSAKVALLKVQLNTVHTMPPSQANKDFSCRKVSQKGHFVEALIFIGSGAFAGSKSREPPFV